MERYNFAEITKYDIRVRAYLIPMTFDKSPINEKLQNPRKM